MSSAPLKDQENLSNEPRPLLRTTIPDAKHKVYPYLLKGLDITRANHVWAADICYLPMRRGYAYLVAIMCQWPFNFVHILAR